jgi:hypothetical protein
MPFDTLFDDRHSPSRPATTTPTRVFAIRTTPAGQVDR